MRVILLLASLLGAWMDWDVGNPVDKGATEAPAVEEPLGRSLDSPFLPPIGR